MIHLFTHTDSDGEGCAILAKLAFQKEDSENKLQIRYCENNTINKKFKAFIESEELKKDDKCYITDISIDETLARFVDENFNNVFLFDHHKTALFLNQYNWATVKVSNDNTAVLPERANLDTCGTELFYSYLVKNNLLKTNSKIKEFVNIICDFDTWRWPTLGESGKISKKVNDLTNIYGRIPFINWVLEQLQDPEIKTFPQFSEKDKLLLDYQQKIINDYIKRKNKTLIHKKIMNYHCGIVFADNFFSELGNALCILNPTVDAVMVINMDGSISYRTNKDNVDVSKIAAHIGGGGHVKSAGASLTATMKKNALNELLKDYCDLN